MISCDEFKKFIKANHYIFEILEKRQISYLLARNWIEKWFSNGEKFSVSEDDKYKLDALRDSLFEYEIFEEIKENEIKNKIRQQFENLINSIKEKQEENNIGIAIAPYLFTWNFKRFRKYFHKKNDFDVFSYFTELGNFVKNKKEDICRFSNKHLFKDEIEEENVKEIFNKINERCKELGIGEEEPINVIKILHIFAPYYFPLIDNSIARSIRLKEKNKSLTFDDYCKWMRCLKNKINCLVKCDVIKELEDEFAQSFLKLIDEGLYIINSTNLRRRLKEYFTEFLNFT